jgi:hypothetical protein
VAAGADARQDEHNRYLRTIHRQEDPMSNLLHRTLGLLLAALAATAALDAQANSSGGRGGGHWSGGHGHWNGGHGHWNGGGHSHVHWGIGVGIGFGGYWPYTATRLRLLPVRVGARVLLRPAAGRDRQPGAGAPAPMFTPRNGQSAVQLEADHRQCDRDAMGFPAAMADASVFHRVVLVCMENRGYAIR